MALVAALLEALVRAQVRALDEVDLEVLDVSKLRVTSQIHHSRPPALCHHWTAVMATGRAANLREENLPVPRIHQSRPPALCHHWRAVMPAGQPANLRVMLHEGLHEHQLWADLLGRALLEALVEAMSEVDLRKLDVGKVCVLGHPPWSEVDLEKLDVGKISVIGQIHLGQHCSAVIPAGRPANLRDENLPVPHYLSQMTKIR